MLDVGRHGRDAVLPDHDLDGVKARMADPAEYFLGSRYEAVRLPGVSEEYYGIPPARNFVFIPPPGFAHASTGFAPLFSFARGGLAEAWTGGCYPLNSHEVESFPFAYGDLATQYDEVARRIGITGEADDLARFTPLHDHLLPPLALDLHSQTLVRSYARVRERLNQSGAYVGRSRVAVLSRSLETRQACDYTGRCLWGCPRGALYTPSQTLSECRTYPGFEYVPDVEVTHLRLGAGNRVRGVVARRIDSGVEQEFPADRVALAAGTLLSTRIFLMSILKQTGERVRLHGLMDNRQILVPFVNLRMLGRQFDPRTYQYHLLGLGLESGSPLDYVHGQITTLKTALVHPLIQRIPLDLGTSTLLFRGMHAALGLVNLNFRDNRRDDNWIELSGGAEPHLQIRYAPDAEERHRLRQAVRRVRRTLLSLSCVALPGMIHVRPMGASVHYAGTVPMTRTPAPFTATECCESRDIGNLFFVDGTTFPFLPAKNITFTLMANAVRVAEAAF
jgi:choline dehydrogenase-like flavoprotein